MDLTSGISKELKRQFIVDENALIRIKSVLDKAAVSLDKPAQVVFYVEREDDRFFETTDLVDVVTDPNMTEKRITLVGIEIREDNPDKNSRRKWIARVTFLAERRFRTIYRDTDEIHIDISTNDKNWALLLADELEPQIERTVNRSKLSRWPLAGIGIFILYGLIKLAFTYNEKLSEVQLKLLTPLSMTIGFIIVMASMLTYVRFLTRGKPSFLVKALGPESVFLWGEEEKQYREREQNRKNVFWGVMVAFIVSALASIAVTIM
jgi:hypothetical protein